MAKNVAVLLSFIPGRLEKMRQIGKDHGWRTSTGNYKNATISGNIIDFIIDLRHDPVYSKIVEKEGIPILHLLKRSLHQYAAARGYLTKKR